MVKGDCLHGSDRSCDAGVPGFWLKVLRSHSELEVGCWPCPECIRSLSMAALLCVTCDQVSGMLGWSTALIFFINGRHTKNLCLRCWVCSSSSSRDEIVQARIPSAFMATRTPYVPDLLSRWALKNNFAVPACTTPKWPTSSLVTELTCLSVVHSCIFHVTAAEAKSGDICRFQQVIESMHRRHAV